MVDTAKAIALLAYLVLTETSQRRETLIGLLWPESDQEHGRAALRRTLSAHNKALGGERLLADRDTVGLELGARPWVDLLQFRADWPRAKPMGTGPPLFAPTASARWVMPSHSAAAISCRASAWWTASASTIGSITRAKILRREVDGALDRLARGSRRRERLRPPWAMRDAAWLWTR